MKTKKFLFIILFFGLFSVAARAQTIKAGLGDELRVNPPVSLLTKITFDLGFLDPDLRTSADFIFLPELRGNLDMHYSIVSETSVTPYGLAGINFSKSSGFNLGGGANVPITDNLDGFVEAKYIFKYDPQASLKFGLLFVL
ncbi:MAG: hypothetical protein ACLFM7_01640 [Bacteroidales bacterium]